MRAPSLDYSSFAKSSELKDKILFTLLVLIVYRVGTFIPLPGVDVTVVSDFFAGQGEGGVVGMFDVFTGGALSRMTIFALNILPYISASIIISLMSSVSKELGNLRKEGASGRQKLNQYTRYLTVLICAVQAYFMAVGLESLTNSAGDPAVIIGSSVFRFSTVISLVGGTLLVVWMGEQITARGIGRGPSLIIFTGIVSGIPGAIAKTFEMGGVGSLSPLAIIGVMVLIIGLIGVIVFVERSHRPVNIHYPKRQMMPGMSQADKSHMPLKINTSGVLPPIFAATLLNIPVVVTRFLGSTGYDWLDSILNSLQRGNTGYMVLYALLIIFFSFFYTAVVFNTEETAENLKNHGGYIPGIRPGKNTAEYLDFVLTRVTTIGAFYLVVICLAPDFLIQQLNIPFYLSGTSLLIVSTVIMDTISQIQSHMLAQQYEQLMKSGNKVKIRRKWR
jgi:preprotein translocase subunit SecY